MSDTPNPATLEPGTRVLLPAYRGRTYTYAEVLEHDGRNVKVRLESPASCEPFWLEAAAVVIARDQPPAGLTSPAGLSALADLAAAVADYEAAWRLRAHLRGGIRWNEETRRHETTPEARELDNEMRAAFQRQGDAERRLEEAGMPLEAVFALSGALVVATSRVTGTRHHENPAHGGAAPVDFVRRYVSEAVQGERT